MVDKSLDGIKVLDFTRVLAGPLATMSLADMGADVVKVEHPIRGDDTRAWGPPWTSDDDNRMSAYFLSVNRHKKSLALNLKHPDAQKIAWDLAMQANVIVENFRVGQMAKFGLDYETISKQNPKVVYCSVTGFGQDGLYHQRAGYDYVVQAMSGLMSITGEKDGTPSKVGVAISDVIAGLYATQGILGSLRMAELTGQGQHIDISLLDTQLAALVNVASNYLVSGNVPARYGNQHANIVPYQTFEASDGAFVVAVGNDGQFRALCQVLGHLEWATDERFATNPQRVANREILITMLQDVFSTKTVKDWEHALLDAGIPVGAIQTVAEALTDEHVKSRDIVQDVNIDGQVIGMMNSPIKLSKTPINIESRPPHLGEHSRSILHEWLDMDDDMIEGFIAKGIITEH